MIEYSTKWQNKNVNNEDDSILNIINKNKSKFIK